MELYHFAFAFKRVDVHIIILQLLIIIGPAADPAKIKGVTAPEAMKRIAKTGAIFVSRGDNSGTHAKEKGLWKAAVINPDGQQWYQQTVPAWDKA